MKQLTREKAIQLLNTDAVYNALELEEFYDEETNLYVSIYNILYTLGVSAEEIEEAMANK